MSQKWPSMGVPRPRNGWTETTAKAVIHARADGRCEGCASGRNLQASHRIARGRQGRWSPANLLLLDNRCHQVWAGANHAAARDLGWFVPTEWEPADVPVWRIHPFAGWWLLADDGFATPAYEAQKLLPVVPDMPPWARDAAVQLDPWWGR